MATANINVRVDENLKKNAEKLFEDLGMNMSTAINIFLRQSVEFEGIPFTVHRVASAELDKRVADVKAGRNVSKVFGSVSELMEDLNAED
ncbi:MAG: type II toxin-antitoxin system RelB/DinJ family antitoxin [Ruminococcus sp.]|nr:type II toxin-antitoxin system RelB/DinJ family antitoxin [Ruminococcus sp.]